MRPIRQVRSLTAEQAWGAVQRGQARLLDLRTELERRRYGWPPSTPRVSLARHVLWPGGQDTIYLCQHANRSKLTGWRGAAEIEGGWLAWKNAGWRPIFRVKVGGRSSAGWGC
jgi:rhodanese-related sulfurtransferase